MYETHRYIYNYDIVMYSLRCLDTQVYSKQHRKLERKTQQGKRKKNHRMEARRKEKKIENTFNPRAHFIQRLSSSLPVVNPLCNFARVVSGVPCHRQHKKPPNGACSPAVLHLHRCDQQTQNNHDTTQLIKQNMIGLRSRVGEWPGLHGSANAGQQTWVAT